MWSWWCKTRQILQQMGGKTHSLKLGLKKKTQSSPAQCLVHSKHILSAHSSLPSILLELVIVSEEFQNCELSCHETWKTQSKFPDPLTCYGKCWQGWFCPWLGEQKVPKGTTWFSRLCLVNRNPLCMWEQSSRDETGASKSDYLHIFGRRKKK